MVLEGGEVLKILFLYFAEGAGKTDLVTHVFADHVAREH